MEYIIELLRDHGITDIAITMQYLPDVIHDYFGDGSDWGVRLSYFEETSPLGTAGSVKNAQAFLDERFIVISGDALTDFDLTAAAAFHQRKEALATIVLKRVIEPLEYGVVMTDEAGRIIRFLEKPSWGEVFSDTVNTGIYILEPEVLDYIEPDVEFDFSNQLFPYLLNQGLPLYGHVSEGYWSDIGNLQQYRQTQFDMLDGRVKVRIRGRQIRPGVYVGNNVQIKPGVKWVGPAFIGDNNHIEDEVEIGEYCIIGKHNKLSRGSSIHRTILWDYNTIAEQNELYGSTLASRIVCKAASQLGDGAVVGSQVTIGPKTVIAPNVKVWPKKQIRENSRVHTSLIWGDQSVKSLYKTYGVTGQPNIDITPEFASRFATAYGSTLAVGKTMTVSSCPQEFAKLLKRTLAASLQSAGVNVIDLGELIPPVARFSIRQLGAAGGIHVQMLGNEKPLCCLECYDASGLPISKATERKVENSFWQEDYGRASFDAIGSYRADPTLSDRYRQRVLEELAQHLALGEHPKQHPERPYRIILAANPFVYSMVSPLFEDLNADIVHVSDLRHRHTLSEFVKGYQADMGVWMDEDGRSLRVVTDQGEEMTQDELMTLQYVSLFHCGKRPAVGVPVSAPHLIESLAEGLGARVIRTREHIRAIMEVSPDLPFHPLYDAVFSVGLLLVNRSRSGLPLSEWLRMIPGVYLHRERIDCPWDAKGKVMRMMMERAKDARVDLLDGIKFYHGGDWVLLLPDSDDPAFKVIAQAANPSQAEALARQYRDQILNLLS
jgi:mannose-1-phosphate guanylyltransferase/phosphomannomutase